MQVTVRVVPRSSRSKVVALTDSSLKAYLNRPAVEGQANRELVELLADYYEVKKYQVKIVRGEKSRDKIIEISRRESDD